MATRPPAARPALTPPLVGGERLTREEFERRSEAMPGLKKAELINGVVHLSSPVRDDQHGLPHSQLIPEQSVDKDNDRH